MGHSGRSQAHLYAGESPAQHQVVEVPQMADAKELALLFSQALAKREIEALEDCRAQPIRVVTFRHAHRGERVGMLALVERVELQAPSPHGAAGRLGVADGARQDPPQPLPPPPPKRPPPPPRYIPCPGG